MFEVLKSDLRGRIGILHTNHGKIETPAFVPVIHPARQSVPAEEIKKMGFGMIITNAYITRNRYGTEAVRKGIHKIIGFDGAIMTDSGGYQVLEYGDVGITPHEMAKFEREILTDIAIPLDRPTGFGMTRRKAGSFVSHTLKVSKETLMQREDNGQVWVGPIQGGEHFDLVAESTKKLVKMGFGMLALGSPVEFMESYEYGLLAQMIVAAKRQMPHSVPLHLFGAGHPLTVGFSVALGCDTFDSASYMLYARHGRYITEDGTRNIRDISVFPCSCRICTQCTPKEINQMETQEKTNSIAIHNLYAIKNEVDKVRQAIFEGRLWEYVIKKARAHPRLFEVVETFVNNGSFLAESTPIFKDKAIFLYDRVDQFRPEVLRYHEMARRFKSAKKKLLITKEYTTKPAYLAFEYREIKGAFGPEVQVCQYSPHLGVIPLEISDVFPAAHHETVRTDFDPLEFPLFEKTWLEFLGNNKFTEIYYDKADKFLGHFMKKIPAGIRKRQFSKKKKKSVQKSNL